MKNANIFFTFLLGLTFNLNTNLYGNNRTSTLDEFKIQKKIALIEIEQQQKIGTSKTNSSNFKDVYLSCTIIKKKEEKRWINIPLRNAKVSKKVNLKFKFTETTCSLETINTFHSCQYIKTIQNYTVYSYMFGSVYLSKDNKYVNIITNDIDNIAEQYSCKIRSKTIKDITENIIESWF